MAELDLSKLSDEQRTALWKAFQGGHTELGWMIGLHQGHWTQAVDRLAVALAPLIERQVREQAAQELLDWAETFARDNNAQWTIRRHIGMCARRIGPKMTTEQVVEALQRGDYVACHLDDAGRAIPPQETR